MTSRLVTGLVAALGLGVGGAAWGLSDNAAQAGTSQPPVEQGQRGASPQGGAGNPQPGDAGRSGPAVPLLSQGPSAARFPRNAEEFDQMFQQVKNWGRWGKDDQLGAANLITDAKRKQALALSKTGIVVSLAHPPITEAAPDNPSPFSHTMNRGFSTDTYSVSYHGYAHSHIDALCHILYKNQTYNGYAREEVLTEKGCAKLGIENLQERRRDARCPRSTSRASAICRTSSPARRSSSRISKPGKSRRASRSRPATPLPAHRPLGTAREARSMAGRPQRRRLSRLDRAVAESTRRGVSRERRRVRR